MEKRLIIFIALTFIVLLLYNQIFPPPKPKQVKPKQAKQQAVKQEKAASKPPSKAEVKPAKPAVQATETVNVDLKNLRLITIQTPLYHAVFTPLGGRLVSWKLNKYKDVMGPKGKPIELIRATIPELPYKGTFYRTSKAVTDAIPMKANVETITLHKGDSPAQLTFTGIKDGIRFSKRYTFYPDKYEADLEWIIENSTEEKLVGNTILSLINKPSKIKEKSKYGQQDYSADILKGSSVYRKKLKKIKEPVTVEGKIGWVALSEKYFVTLAAPESNAFNQVVLLNKANALDADITATAVVIDPGQTQHFKFRLYNGPKLLANLKQFGKDAEKAIDYGWFGIIARPLMQFLNFTNKYTHNYGIDIILLTILIKIIFWPLTHKSYKSMADMQKIQPLMQKLREKYKDDKERLNQEMMRLYKQHKVNPLGGCLPMLLQIPVFFALYKALLDSVELRHAPFFWWIQDLSAKDPYYITPIIMGLTMLIQQKMTPSTGDPKMAKMMLIMPIVFTFMFLNFPSGLVIYWLVNNVLSIGQQFYTNRKLAHGR
ncbi:MAG: membrane protein insertase YidC [Deltaproteobacteria bacterium]|nr:membrane protein insertase YidC [Deltaproteobacteria bacterium]